MSLGRRFSSSSQQTSPLTSASPASLCALALQAPASRLGATDPFPSLDRRLRPPPPQSCFPSPGEDGDLLRASLVCATPPLPVCSPSDVPPHTCPGAPNPESTRPTVRSGSRHPAAALDPGRVGRRRSLRGWAAASSPGTLRETGAGGGGPEIHPGESSGMLRGAARGNATRLDHTVPPGGCLERSSCGQPASIPAPGLRSPSAAT